MADWRKLPVDLLEIVVQRLIHIIDYVCFGAVCVAWRSFALKNHFRLPSQIPVLMIPWKVETHTFYSVTERRVYNFQLPVPYEEFCGGSEYGWVVIFGKWRLLNPFSRKTIQLPKHGVLYRAVFSSNPSLTLDFLVLGIFTSRGSLGFCRPGDEAWTFIDWEDLRTAHDAIFYNQKIYVLHINGEVTAFDVNLLMAWAHPCPQSGHQLRPPLMIIASPPPIVGDWQHKRYLVKSMGDLLLVEKINKFYVPTSHDYKRDSYRTPTFNIYKLDVAEGKWVKVESLGDCTLFIGDETSLSTVVLDIPGCKSNCIYFVDEYNQYFVSEEGAHDFGIFNLEDLISSSRHRHWRLLDLQLCV